MGCNSAFKVLRNNLEAVPVKHSIDSLQKTAILGTSHITRKVLQCEAWAVGITVGSRELPGRKGLWKETWIIIIIIIICRSQQHWEITKWKGSGRKQLWSNESVVVHVFAWRKLGTTTKDVLQDTRCPDTDLDREHPHYKTRDSVRSAQLWGRRSSGLLWSLCW